MSVNLTLDLTVAGFPDAATDALLDAIRVVLQKHDIARDVVLSSTSGEIHGSTPNPIIVSRSYEWCPQVEADIAAAVAEAAADATTEVAWGSPDDED